MAPIVQVGRRIQIDSSIDAHDLICAVVSSAPRAKPEPSSMVSQQPRSVRVDGIARQVAPHGFRAECAMHANRGASVRHSRTQVYLRPARCSWPRATALSLGGTFSPVPATGMQAAGGSIRGRNKLWSCRMALVAHLESFSRCYTSEAGSAHLATSDCGPCMPTARSTWIERCLPLGCSEDMLHEWYQLQSLSACEKDT